MLAYMDTGSSNATTLAVGIALVVIVLAAVAFGVRLLLRRRKV